MFVGADFSSGYIKNIYTGVKKTDFVLSKFVYVFLYCLAVYIINFLVFLLLTYVFGTKTFYSSIDLKSGILYKHIISFALRFLGLFAVGGISVFLNCLIKNNFVVFGFEFFYQLVICLGVLGFLNLTGLKFDYFLPFSSVFIIFYTVTDYVYLSFIAFLLETIVFFFLSYLAFSRKNV